MNETSPQKPSVLLLIATGCQHCPSVLQSLSELVKAGDIASLEVVNIVEAPERARALNVRSVPWVRIGEYELVGLKSKSELKQWIEKSQQPESMADYFEELMTSGELSKVQAIIEKRQESIQGLYDIMTNPKASLSARIGVGAIMEGLAGSELLKQQVPELGQLCQHKVPQVRNDACYYLELTGDPAALEFLRPLLEDSSEEVRESAEDALKSLQQNTVEQKET